MTITEETKGVYIIAATPFTANGALDLASIDRLVEFYVEKGVSGITILGMMGEAPKLSAEEQLAVLTRFMDRVDARVPVVVGVSNSGMSGLCWLTQQAMERGAAGVMVAPVAGLKTEDAVSGYIDQVVEAIGPDVPWIYQDYPQATGVSISVATLLRMVADHPSLKMLKHEDCPGLGKLSRLRAEQDRRISVLCGNGGLYLPQELARGADGAMTGFAFPEMLVQVVNLFAAGEIDRAEDLFNVYLPLVRHEQQPGFGLALRKEVLHRRGVIASATTRAPGPALRPIDQVELARLLSRQDAALAAMR